MAGGLMRLGAEPIHSEEMELVSWWRKSQVSSVLVRAEKMKVGADLEKGTGS
jgi:hypothetical protein